MVEAFDRTWLEAWLRARGASEQVLLHVELELGAEAPDLTDRDCSVLLDALLSHAVDPVVLWRRVQGLRHVATRLGYSEEVLDGFVQDSLRITLRRLEAFGALRLPLGATPEDVKAAHRRLIKLVHPDRLPGADQASVEAAERRVMVLNQARALLNQPYEDVILDGGDDLLLDGGVIPVEAGGPSPLDLGLDLGAFWVRPGDGGEDDDIEDAPTELYDEVSWSDLERIGLLPGPVAGPVRPVTMAELTRDESTEIEVLGSTSDPR